MYRQPHPIEIAKAVLSRHVPQCDEESILAVAEAQKVVAEALRRGDVRACRWLLTVLAKRMQHGLDGIIGQLVALLDECCDILTSNPDLAAQAIFIARDLGKREVMQAALRGARLGMHPPRVANEIEGTGHHDTGPNFPGTRRSMTVR